MLVEKQDCKGLLDWLHSGGKGHPEYKTRKPYDDKLNCNHIFDQMNSNLASGERAYYKLIYLLLEQLADWGRIDKKKKELDGKLGCDLERAELVMKLEGCENQIKKVLRFQINFIESAFFHLEGDAVFAKNLTHRLIV